MQEWFWIHFLWFRMERWSQIIQVEVASSGSGRHTHVRVCGGKCVRLRRTSIYLHVLPKKVKWIGCLTSQSTIFQSYIWRHIDVQADWRRKLDLRSGSQRHRHFGGFFNVSVQTPTRGHPFYTPFIRLLRHARDTQDTFSTLNGRSFKV